MSKQASLLWNLKRIVQPNQWPSEKLEKFDLKGRPILFTVPQISDLALGDEDQCYANESQLIELISNRIGNCYNN